MNRGPVSAIPSYWWDINSEFTQSLDIWGWSGAAKVLGKLSVPGRPTNYANGRQGHIALAVGAGGGCLDSFFSRLSFLLFFSLFGRRPDIE